MLPYLITFSISILFTFFAQKNVNNRLIFFSCSVIAVLVPSLLAGLRDSGIGTDTKVYVDYIWADFKYITNWNQFYTMYQQKQFNDIEPLYLCLNYIASLFGSKVNNIYFLSNLLTNLFIYLSAYDNRKKSSMTLFMFIYLFSYYNMSLNLVRQSLALSFCLYSFKYIEQKKWWKFIVMFIIINLAHNTGLFFVAFLILYILFEYLKNNKSRKLILSFTTLCVVLGTVFIDITLTFFVGYGILPSKFLIYNSLETAPLIKSVFINYIIYIFLFISFGVIIKQKDLKTEFAKYTYLKINGTLLFASTIISKWAFRISYYFNIITDCIMLPRALFFIKKRLPQKYILILSATVILILIIWYWTIIFNNGNQTYPYKSKILGI